MIDPAVVIQCTSLRLLQLTRWTRVLCVVEAAEPDLRRFLLSGEGMRRTGWTQHLARSGKQLRRPAYSACPAAEMNWKGKSPYGYARWSSVYP